MTGKFCLLAGIAIAAGACGKNNADGGAQTDTPPAMTNDQGPPVLGSAEIKSADGKILGIVDFTQTAAGISIMGNIGGLAGGEYGMHLHTVGLCEGPEFTTAGSHWNPTNKMHGVNNPQGPHLGDLPNLMVKPDSTGMVQGVTMGGTFTGGDNALMDADGAAFVIHAAPDDYKTDPSGNSGARLACGVIIAK